MKKISTFILAGLLTMAVSAAERQPMVTVNTTNDYEVQIDGQTYNNGNSGTIPNMVQGTHRVEVYQVTKQLFGKRRTLVSTSSFELRDNDVTINVDQNGQLRISQSRNGTDGTTTKRNRGRTDNDWNNGRKSEKSNGGVFNRDGNDDGVDDDNDIKKEKKAKKVKHNNGKKKGHYKNGKLGNDD